MVRVIRRLRSPDDMTPPGTDFGPGRDRNHSAILVSDVLIARKARIIHILDWVVAIRRTNALQLALVYTIDRYFLEDGVGRCDRRYA